MKNQNHPGVYVPPPVIYAGFFFLSKLLQYLLPIKNVWFDTMAAHIAAWALIVLALLISLPALFTFLISKNTLITIKPANSLQTTGIYSFTRNPMYLGLLLLYAGLAPLLGNWWTFILIPPLITVVTSYVIRNEEQYLHHKFKEEFGLYKSKVRRWI